MDDFERRVCEAVVIHLDGLAQEVKRVSDAHAEIFRRNGLSGRGTSAAVGDAVVVRLKILKARYVDALEGRPWKEDR